MIIFNSQGLAEGRGLFLSPQLKKQNSRCFLDECSTTVVTTPLYSHNLLMEESINKYINPILLFGWCKRNWWETVAPLVLRTLQSLRLQEVLSSEDDLLWVPQSHPPSTIHHRISLATEASMMLPAPPDVVLMMCLPCPPSGCYPEDLSTSYGTVCNAAKNKLLGSRTLSELMFDLFLVHSGRGKGEV